MIENMKAELRLDDEEEGGQTYTKKYLCFHPISVKGGFK